MVPSAASLTRGATAAPSVSSASTTGSWLSEEVFLPEAAPSSDSLFLQEISYHSNEKTSRTKAKVYFRDVRDVQEIIEGFEEIFADKENFYNNQELL